MRSLIADTDLSYLTQFTADGASTEVLPDGLVLTGLWQSTGEMLPPSPLLTLGLWHSIWDAGMEYRFEEDYPGVNVLCVIAGGWAFHPDHEEHVVPQPAAVGAAGCRMRVCSPVEPISMLPETQSLPASARI